MSGIYGAYDEMGRPVASKKIEAELAEDIRVSRGKIAEYDLKLNNFLASNKDKNDVVYRALILLRSPESSSTLNGCAAHSDLMTRTSEVIPKIYQARIVEQEKLNKLSTRLDRMQSPTKQVVEDGPRVRFINAISEYKDGADIPTAILSEAMKLRDLIPSELYPVVRAHTDIPVRTFGDLARVLAEKRFEKLKGDTGNV